MKSGLSIIAIAIAIAIAIIVALCLFPADGPAVMVSKMYRWTDEKGVVHWSNRIPEHEDAEEHPELEYPEEIYRPRHHAPRTDPPVSYPDDPPPSTGRVAVPPAAHPWADQALRVLKDISSLVGTIGVAYQDYKAMTQEAAILAGRVAERERREQLFDILELHEIALSCWYNDIFSREPFPRRMSDLKYRIFTEYDRIVQTYDQCLQGMWDLAPGRIRHYEDRFK